MNGPVNLTANFTGAVQLTVSVTITRASFFVSGQVIEGYEVGFSIRNTGTATAENVHLNLNALTLNGFLNLTPFRRIEDPSAPQALGVLSIES